MPYAVALIQCQQSTWSRRRWRLRWLVYARTRPATSRPSTTMSSRLKQPPRPRTQSHGWNVSSSRRAPKRTAGATRNALARDANWSVRSLRAWQQIARMNRDAGRTTVASVIDHDRVVRARVAQALANDEQVERLGRPTVDSGDNVAQAQAGLGSRSRDDDIKDLEACAVAA